MSADVSREDGVAIVTIDSSNGLNVLDLPTLTELRDRLQEIEADGDLRSVVVTGAGERAFSAGADIKYMSELDGAQGAAWGELGHQVGRLLETMPKVSIAAINGLALGGGCEVALACDLRYASSTATLGQPEVNIGVVPGFGGTQRLARVTSLGFAKDLILTGRTVDAEEALRRGLVDEIHDPVLDKALEVARSFNARSATAIEAAKALCNAALQGDHAANLRREREWFGRLFDGADAKEGLAAFVEKRAPRFLKTSQPPRQPD
jgi:enoyl-CoA hydratase